MIMTTRKHKMFGKRGGLFVGLLTLAMGLCPMESNAQLSQNPDKFLGNITTGWNNGMDTNGLIYSNLWNQVTPENASKWSSVEGTRGRFNWGCDTPFNYAKEHGFTYKFHAFVWGAQYPDWLSSLSIKDRYAAIVNWFDAIRNKYDTLPMIDVVNEAVGMHQQGNPMMKESLGGPGKTGYDWLIKAFEMAYERFPNSILIYNDYNSFQHDVENYITLVQTLRDAGAPIDAYGNQSHDVNDISESNLKNVMKKQQDALKMPMYITELDVNIENDAQQKAQFQRILPAMWEADYCAGVTLWGYIYGSTWVDYSGLYRGSTPRPAMDYIKEYMATDAAKNAKSPFPGMKKEASIYIRPLDLKVARGDKLPIKVRASMATKTIEKMELYVGDELIATMTEAPYMTEYAVPADATTGWKTLKAVATTTDGATYERYSRFNVLSSTVVRGPYNEQPFELPGTIVTAEYDKGASGVTYNKASRSATTATQTEGWMEYTVDVKEDGLYSFDAEVASASGGAFHIAEYGFDNLTFFGGIIDVPKTGGNTKFQMMHGLLDKPLTAGRHRLCINIDKGGFCIKSIAFHRYDVDKENIKVSITSLDPSSIYVGDKTTITVNATSANSTIDNVRVYVDNMLIGTLTEAPYTIDYVPQVKGNVYITATATDAEGKENTSAKRTLFVKGKRVPYFGEPIPVPGMFQAEDFDGGGDGLSFHDSNSENEGDVNYRTDSEGVDFVKGNSGVAIGYTNADEWLEYSVDVKKAGKYTCVATVSSGTTNSGFKISLVQNGKLTDLWTISVPQTGSNDWGTYKAVENKTQKELKEGTQILRFTITGSSCNIDKVELIRVKDKGDVNGDYEINVGDIMAIINYMAGNTSGMSLSDADVNGDKAVNIGDIMAVINLMVSGER